MSTGGGSGALMQIAAIGVENRYLTIDPEITYFVSKYNKHTNFATESIQQQLNDAPLPNNKLTVNIDRKGDLIYKSYLEFTVPPINTSTNTENATAWQANNEYMIDDIVKASSLTTGIGESQLITTIPSNGDGSEAFGGSSGPGSPNTVVINADGTVAAIYGNGIIGGNTAQRYGIVKIYGLDNGIWKERDILEGNTHQGFYGRALALSGDGNILVVGAYRSNIGGGQGGSASRGYTKVYEWNGTNYAQKGNVITSGIDGAQEGYSVAISKDGNLVATAANKYPRPLPNQADKAGRIRLYRFDNGWVNTGIIRGDQDDAEFGSSLYLSDIGDCTNTVVVIGECSYNTSTNDTGRVHVYNWDPAETNLDGITPPVPGYWKQRGSILVGREGPQSIGSLFGYSVAGNSTCDIIAVGAIETDGDSTLPFSITPPYQDLDRGEVYIYEWNGTDYIQKGKTLIGTQFDNLGRSISFDTSGNHICVSSALYLTNNPGNAYVYKWDDTQWVLTIPRIPEIRNAQMSKDGLTIVGGNSMYNFNEGIGKIVKLYRSGLYRCIQSGTSNSSEPTWEETTNNIDNSVIWERYDTDLDAIVTSSPFYMARQISTSNLTSVYDFIDYISVSIEGKPIVTHNSKWLKIWNNLTVPEGKRSGLNSLLQIGSNSSLIGGSNVLRLPLQFWFCRNPSAALPIIALQSDDITIDIKLKNFVSSDLSRLEFWVDYVFLDDVERQKFALSDHKYLIDQVQTTGVEYINKISKIRLDFNHPVKEIVWQLDSSNHNKLDKVGLELNGENIFKKKSADYFSHVQRYNFHTGSNVGNYIYVHSFSLAPEDHNPSGTINFSRIDNAELLLDLNNSAVNANVEVFAVNYNVLIIKNGYGHVLFSS